MKSVGLSERRSCKLMVLNRATYRYKPTAKDDGSVRECLRLLAAQRPRFGAPRLTVLLRQEFGAVNHKRVERMYREEGLQLPRKRGKKRGVNNRAVALFVPSEPNERWSMDFMSDSLCDGRRFRVLTVMDEGFHGLTYPHPERLYGILFGEIRGLFWFSPILLLTPIALYRYWRTPSSKGEVITITALAVYYILWNSSYFYWHGGQATGPRHIVPMLPFICLPFALLWTRAGAWLKWGLVSLFTLSFFISLISISVRTPGLVEGHNVLFEALIPRFFEGNIPQVNILRVYIGLLEMSGPEMLLTLIPLFLALILGALYIRKLLGQEELSAP